MGLRQDIPDFQNLAQVRQWIIDNIYTNNEFIITGDTEATAMVSIIDELRKLLVRVIYNKGDDPDNPPDLDVDNPTPPGWTLTMPPVDTYWLLSTEKGDYIVTQDGDQWLTTVDGQYIWASTEVLTETGAFDHWSTPTRISGRNGIPTEYTEYRFQKNGSPDNPPAIDKTNADPLEWTIQMPSIGDAEFLWAIKANKLPDGTLVSAWSDPFRMNGVDGGYAAKGDPGPFLMPRGIWDDEKIYKGTAEHIDAVKYEGLWYVARVDAGEIPAGTLPTDTQYWRIFDGQFESVATGLLLAQLAYIENLGVRFVRTSDTGQRIEISGDDNNIILYDQFGNEVLRIDDNVDSGHTGEPLAGIRVTDPATGRVSYLTGNGVFANTSGTQFFPATSGYTTNASIVGLLTKRNNGGVNGISAAVVGIDQTSGADGNSESWGGLFSSLKVLGKVELPGLKTGGVNFGCRTISQTHTCTDDDLFIFCYNTNGTIHVNLPPNPQPGRLIYVRAINEDDVWIYGDAQHILLGGGGGHEKYQVAAREMTMCVWDGQYWHAMKLRN